MKSFSQYIREEAPAMSVGSGMQGLASAKGEPIAGSDPVMTKTILRRKPHDLFGGRAVFKVKSDDFHKAAYGKKKFKHYRSYVGGELGEEIREYAEQNPNEPIIVQDEKTGAMFYLKHGKNK